MYGTVEIELPVDITGLCREITHEDNILVDWLYNLQIHERFWEGVNQGFMKMRRK